MPAPTPERPAAPLRAPFVGPIPDIAMASPPVEYREEVLSTELEPVQTEAAAAEDVTPTAPPQPVLTQDRQETPERFMSEPSTEPAPAEDARTVREAEKRPEPAPEPVPERCP